MYRFLFVYVLNSKFLFSIKFLIENILENTNKVCFEEKKVSLYYPHLNHLDQETSEENYIFV